MIAFRQHFEAPVRLIVQTDCPPNEIILANTNNEDSINTSDDWVNKLQLRKRKVYIYGYIINHKKFR